MRAFFWPLAHRSRTSLRLCWGSGDMSTCVFFLEIFDPDGELDDLGASEMLPHVCVLRYNEV